MIDVCVYGAMFCGCRCDDCCGGSTDFIALQSRLYNTIKAADPHHITSGAVQCHNVWMWSDVENGLLPESPLKRANDSQTQLSLDYPVIENYGMILSEPSGGAKKGDAIPGWVNPLLAQVMTGPPGPATDRLTLTLPAY